MLEPYTRVSVESPPSDDLPSGFDRTPVPSCDTNPKIRRHIYLRHGDTIHFEDYACALRVSVVLVSHSANTSFAEGEKIAAVPEVQVKSSAHQPSATATGRGGAPLEDDETDDEDDLDGPIKTPLVAEDSTPATSRPTDTLAVKDTPSRPLSRESNHVYSTAQDKIRSPDFIGHSNGADGNTPAARAGASRGRKVKANPSEDAESQFVFPDQKGQTTYGGTPRSRRQPKEEVEESPSKDDLPSEPLNEEAIQVPQQSRRSLNRIKIDNSTSVTMSSPNRKRSLSETDGDDDNDSLPASTAPPTKKARGRPRKDSEALNFLPMKSGKKRGRPSKGSKVSESGDDPAEPPSSTGKLKRLGRKPVAKIDSEAEDDEEEVAGTRRRTNASPDLDPRASATPQSSAAHVSGKPPTKILLSKSAFTDDSKAKGWLKKHGAPVDDKIPGKRSNFACVVAIGELLATPKVLRSVALGKRVVTDEWLKACMKQDQLLDLDGYVHDDLAHTMNIKRNKLLEGKALFVTTALEKAYGDGFAHIKELAAALGAHHVHSGAAKNASGMSDVATIFLGYDSDDADAKKLTEEYGRTVYQKTLLAQSTLQGELLLDHDEFKWDSKPVKGKKGKK